MYINIRKLFILVILVVAIDAKSINIEVNSVDINEVLTLSKQRIKKIHFNKLKNSSSDVEKYVSQIEDIQASLKSIDKLNANLFALSKEFDELSPEIHKFAKFYDRKMNKIYRKNSSIARDFYVVVVHKMDQDYNADFDNYIIDKYSIKKYDQQTILTKSTTQKSSLTQEIKTQKDFGQKKIEIIKNLPLRDKGINIKIIKVTQKPFKKSTTSKIAKGAVSSKEMSFEQSGVYVSQIDSFENITDKIVQKFNLPQDRIKDLISKVAPKIDLQQSKEEFLKASAQIENVLKLLDKFHIKLTKNFNKTKAQYNNLQDEINDATSLLQKQQDSIVSLLKPFKIKYPKDNNVEFRVITPKMYSENVELGEEGEFILRKIKSYLKKIDVSEVSQSETLKDAYDLSANTKNISKTLSFQTINFYPYIQNNGKMGLLIFASVKIKEDVSEDDIIEVPLKYAVIRFVPIKKGNNTIFVAQDEISIGVVKQYLQTSKNKNFFKKNFDKYCIEDSTLPEEAWDFKNVDTKYYDYPAVCYNIEKIPKFIKWLSKVTDKDIYIPTFDDWVYVATNSQSTKYPWGDKSVEELAEDDERVENIYYPDSKDVSISKIRTFTKSLSGIYDLGGNLFELVMFEDEYYYKGNSFSSFIEETDGEPSEYESDLGASIGLRVFYKE